MAKFCTECGAPLEDNAKFCVECGATVPEERIKVNSVSEPPQSNSQQVVPQVIIRENDSGSKGVIVLLLIIIVILAVGGSYLYLDSQQEPAAVVVHHDKAPSVPKEKTDGEREYVTAAVTAFRENEESLASLAAAINSGSYSQVSLLNMASDTVHKVNTHRAQVQQKASSVDASVSKDINEMFDIEVKRVECMRQGIQGNTDQYRVGGEYYDQFQLRFETLKGRYGL